MRLFSGCALLVAVLVAGCTNASSPVSGDDDDDDVAALTIGIEPWQVAPGQDQVWCKTMKAPGDGTYDVSRIRVNMTGGSHHFILYRSDVAQADGFGACEEMDRTFITGSQTPGTYETQFPDGKAMPIFGGEQLVLESHYANASETDVTAQVTVEFFTIAHDEVDDYLQTVILPYTDFEIPPMTNDYLDGVSFNEIPGLSVWMLSSHTHSRMTKFTADRVEAGIPTRIYENTDWHAPVQTVFDPPFVGKADNQLAWACTWNNETDHPIYHGSTTDDEMCILVATFFPALDYSP